jgi:hypothetical protein
LTLRTLGEAHAAAHARGIVPARRQVISDLADVGTGNRLRRWAPATP